MKPLKHIKGDDCKGDERSWTLTRDGCKVNHSQFCDCQGTGKQPDKIICNIEDFDLNLIPKSKTRKEQKQTKCINCGNKFDMVSAVFTPICNDCKFQKLPKKGDVIEVENE